MSEGAVMTRGGRRCSLMLAVVGVFAGLASGCMVGPDYHPPQVTAPDAWAGVATAPATQPSVATAEPAELTHWWAQFKDPTLTELVEAAVTANLDLQLAEARLRQARAARGVAVGGLWPAVTASAAYQRGHTAGVTPNNGTADLFQSGLDAVWELDVFGGVRRNVESASANIQAAVESLRYVQVSLVAEVALNYVQLRGAQQEIAVAQKNVLAQQHTAEITRQKYSAGFVSLLDVANADANVATTAAQIPGFETTAQQAIYALSVLLARPPAALVTELAPTGPLPSVPAAVPAGLPSDLVRRRPDIREAEAQLHAATAQIGVATADLFPQFSLTGSVSWQSNLLGTWWSDVSRSFGVGPSVTWPIFQGGALVANIRVQEALRDQAFVTYQKTVLAAFQDVESALVAFTNEQRHRQALQDAVAANRKAVDLSTLLYSEGLTDFVNVLVAQTALYQAENALVQSEQNIATDLIALYKALGGGWESVPPQSPTMPVVPSQGNHG